MSEWTAGSYDFGVPMGGKHMAVCHKGALLRHYRDAS